MTMLFGPSLDAELAYRRERLATQARRRRSSRRAAAPSADGKRTGSDGATQVCEDLLTA
ncbi:MAG TPA: hypothetical protein VFX41_12670 [Actinomycetales bacterium]|jgi:hypothetical protein|nr:hypothetical protein [Actinomycetales bacterium]